MMAEATSSAEGGRRVFARGLGLLVGLALGVMTSARGGDALVQELGEMPVSTAAGAGTITNVTAFYQIPPELIATKLPVRIQGIVTCADPEWRTLVVQDGDRGLYLTYHPEQGAVRIGDAVEISGSTALDGGNYRIEPYTVRVIGGPGLPAPRLLWLRELRLDQDWMDWVEVVDRVAWATTLDGRLYGALGSGTNQVMFYVQPPYERTKPDSLVDSTISIRGVFNVYRDPRTPRIGAQIRVPGRAFLRVVEPRREDPFALPVEAVRQVRESAEDRAEGRRRIQGFLISQVPGTALSVQDHTGVAVVETTMPTQFERGLALDIAGFPQLRGGRLVLKDAVARLGERASPPGMESGPSNAGQSDSLPLLTNLLAVSLLTPSEVAAGHPVRVKARVTRAMPNWGSVFISDETGALYVDGTGAGSDGQVRELKPGDDVVLEAVTAPGNYRPILQKVKVVEREPGRRLPRAVRTTAEQLYTGALDCERVEVRGIVREVQSAEEIVVRLEDNGISFSANAPVASLPTNLVGSVVRLRGVCSGRFDGRGRIQWISIGLNSLADLEVEQEAAAPPRQLAAGNLAELARRDLAHWVNLRIQLAGVVAQSVPGQFAYVLCEGHGIRVPLPVAVTLEPGDHVEATGYLGQERRWLILRGASMRRLESGSPPPPVPLGVEQVFDPAVDGQFVELEAHVVGVQHQESGTRLTLQLAGWLFEAVSIGRTNRDARHAHVQEGAVVRVRGVHSVDTDPKLGTARFQVLFDASRDLAIVTQAPWWNRQRAVSAAAVLLAGLCFALLWVHQLRSRVQGQMVQIRQRLEKEAILERQHRDLVEHASDFIFTTDREGRFTSANPAGERLLGVKRMDLLRTSFVEWVVPEDRALLARFQAALPGLEAAGATELVLRRGDGQRIVIELSIRPVRDGDQLAGFQCIARDVTARRQAEEARRLDESRLEVLVRLSQMTEASLDDIASFALEEGVRLTQSGIGYVAFTNEDESVLTMHAWSKSAMEQRRMEELQWTFIVKETGLWGEPVRQRRAVITNDYIAADLTKKGLPVGHVPLRRHLGVPVFDGGRIVIVAGVGNKESEYTENDVRQLTLLMGGMWQILKRRQTEAEKERLAEQLLQSHKMESIGRLAGGVAHDFNNMLQAILGNVSLALDEVAPSDPLRENLEEIRTSAERSANLTRQLLAFARKQTIRPVVLDLNDTVAGMLKMLRRLIGEDVELDWSPAEGLWPVTVDPGQIDQILANLCVNARDALAQNGCVTIRTSNVVLDADYVSKHADSATGDYVMLAVSDNGRGMDADTRSRLFEPFFTTKELGKGTGLGLATVFGIVKQNRGLIDVISEPGQGSTFRIYLPRSQPSGREHDIKRPAQSLRGHETILLVEDEPQVLQLGKRILEQHGYRVLTAVTPHAALGLAGNHKGPLHLLITDVVMPGMNGKALCDRLRRQRPELKCLFISGYTADVIAPHGVLDSGVEFVHKPFTNEVLVTKVRELLGLAEMVESQTAAMGS